MIVKSLSLAMHMEMAVSLNKICLKGLKETFEEKEYLHPVLKKTWNDNLLTLKTLYSCFSLFRIWIIIASSSPNFLWSKF